MEEIVESLFHFATIDHPWNDLMTAQRFPATMAEKHTARQSINLGCLNLNHMGALESDGSPRHLQAKGGLTDDLTSCPTNGPGFQDSWSEVVQSAYTTPSGNR